MPYIPKKVLEPGNYKSPDGDIAIPPERIRHWVNQFNAMRRNGITIPVPWGHLSKAVPAEIGSDEHEWQRTKFNAGFVDKLKATKDGLYAVLDVPLHEDAKRVGTVVREVSPWIVPRFVDGKGRVYEDVIGHVALCQQAVAPGQENFQPAIGMRLSLRDRTGYRFSVGDKMADETTPDAPADDAGGGDTENLFDLNDMAEGESKPKLLELLDSAGLPIGDYEDLADLEKKLMVALETKKAHHEQDEAEESEEEAAGVAPPITPDDGGGQMMSLQQNPVALSLFSKLQATEKQSLADRVKRLVSSGRITPAIATSLVGETSGYRMSLTPAGDTVKSGLHDKLALLEQLPAGGAWEPGERGQRMNLEEAEVPDEMKLVPVDAARDSTGRPMTEKELQELVNRMSGRTVTK